MRAHTLHYKFRSVRKARLKGLYWKISYFWLDKDQIYVVWLETSALERRRHLNPYQLSYFYFHTQVGIVS